MTYKIKADYTKEMLEDIKMATGFDASAELEKMLTLMFDNNVSKWKAINREGQIDSILEDKPFTPIIIEETEEYKMLSDERKENYKKYGKALWNEPKKK